jgi:hypothetical protein
MITTKLDNRTSREWEQYKITKECTTLNQLKTFLGTHANLLETIDQNEAEKFRTNCNNPARKENKTFITSTESSCPVCNEHHAIYSCTTFLNLNINNRIKKIKELKLCLNCLKGGHVQIRIL